MENKRASRAACARGRAFRLIVTCLAASLACQVASAQREDENMDVSDGGVREVVGGASGLPARIAASEATGQNASSGADDAVLRMATAYRRHDTTTLTALLPRAQGSVLEPWAAYWELGGRLSTATPQEVEGFLRRYAGTYQEDRLRNDWLLQLGRQRDFQTFARDYAAYRMRDDREVACYALVAGVERSADPAEVLRANWYPQKDAGDACPLAARTLLAQHRIAARDVWRKAWLAAAGNRQAAAKAAVAVVDSAAAEGLSGLWSDPAGYLAAAGSMPPAPEMAVLALTRVAAGNPGQAAGLMQMGWASRLDAASRDWVWADIGRQSALNLEPDAINHYSQVRDLSVLSPDQLAWMARAALRMGYWPQVRQAIEAMPAAMQQEPVWTYWKARALQGRFHLGRKPDIEAATLYLRIAGNQGFYAMLAQEALGQRIGTPTPAPAPLTAAERQAAQANPGLVRALRAMDLGLRSEATREWNYTTNLHTPGGMRDRELLAAADLACARQWWDRCINTSERTRSVVDMRQRYPLPFRDSIVTHSQETGVDPAYVYAVIRQESRFTTSARSGVGAAGLMQVMPATARWTARKLGIPYDGSLHDLDTNLRIGTGYLKLLLDDFGGSLPLAVAAYNAGPNRPKAWRNGPVLEGAIWAENIPFGETRDYVQKVLANTTNYAVVLGGQPQSLLARLGQVGPLLQVWNNPPIREGAASD